MKKSSLFLFLLLVSTFVPGFARAQAARPAAPAALSAVVLGYYPSWETGVTPADLNLRLFTHICHAFLMADAMGNIKTEGAIPNPDLITQAHAVGVKVLASLGGADSGSGYFNAIGADPEAVAKYVDEVVAFVAKNHYDGVDVDWEFPTTESDKENLANMVVLLRQGLSKKVRGALITMAVPASDGSGKFFDDAKLMPLVDFINIMTYDFHGDWGSSGHNANLFHDPKDRTSESNSAQEGMEYWTKKGWPKQKLVVGIPCYGHGFPGGAFYRPQGPKSAHSEIAYKDVLKLIADGWKNMWDKDAYVPYVISPQGNEIISYESTQSAQLKGQWTRQQGYRGIFFWDITQDAINKDNVIVHAARNGYAGTK